MLVLCPTCGHGPAIGREGYAVDLAAVPSKLAEFLGEVYGVAFSPDGRTVATGSADTTILLWDVTDLTK